MDELATLLGVTKPVLISDLKHLQLSLRHRPETLLMVPPLCTTCGFRFAVEEPKMPSKCPACKSKAIEMPIFKVDRAEA